MSPAAPDLLAALRQVAAVAPVRPALYAHGRKPASFGTLIEMLDSARVSLRAAGIMRGSRVATILPNGPETAVAILAVASVATCVPVNPAFPTAEVEKLLQQAGVTHVIAGGARAVETGLPQLTLRPLFDGAAGAFALDGVIEDIAPEDEPDEDGSRVALVLHTSGSTGTPKRVPLTVANLTHSAASLALSLQLRPDDICFNMMPMFHIGALVDLMLAPLGAGGAVAFAREISTPALFDGLSNFWPSWFQAVPTVLRDVLSHTTTDRENADLARLRFVRAVSQPLPVSLQQTFEARFGVKLVPIFGMTETAGLITSVPLGVDAPGSVGQPFGCEVRIVDGFGNVQPAGKRGEVVISGANVMIGYEDGGAADTFRGLWLRSGDEGYFDDRGMLFLSGRLKDIINRGGEKISPIEIDLALADHPQIVEAAAFPLPHLTLGEDVGVAVVARGELSGREVVEHLRGQLADYKLPRQVVFLDRLPRVPSGKLDRLALPHIAANGRHATTRTPPDAERAKTIAALWREVLEVEDVALEDNFFDLGGDSLRAMTLAMRLEEQFGESVPTGELFDAPTLGGMAALIDRSTTRFDETGDLNPAIRASLTRIMAGWQGQRLPGSLVVGRNTLGRKTPFFWIPQTLHGFEALAGHLDPERPIYGMTSLSQTGLKTDPNTRHLAKYYAKEMLRIQPGGPFLIGGFCQGGVVAFHTAQALREKGHEVALLALQDRFIPENYDGTVSLFWGRREWSADYPHDKRPERAWSRYYTGPVEVHMADADHFDLHNPPHLQIFAQQLEADMARAEAGVALPSQLERYSTISFEALRFEIKAGTPVFPRRGEECEIRASVTNRGGFTWYPDQGIVLAARWRVWSRAARYVAAGYCEFEEPVRPGKSVEVTLHIRVPTDSMPLFLEIAVREDGMSFGDDLAHRRWWRPVVALSPRVTSIQDVPAGT